LSSALEVLRLRLQYNTNPNQT